jgi:PKHD-type hydroxylase
MDIDENLFKDKGIFSPYVYVENVLSDEEINKLFLDITNNDSLMPAREDNTIKKTDLIFIPEHESYYWLSEKINVISNFINTHYFGFEIKNVVEMQVSILKKSHLYRLHSDIEYNVPLDNDMRKITFIIQLTDESEYEGGIIKLYHGSNYTNCLKTKGLMFLFPSNIYYEIEPIINGEKKILIGWITGKK